MQLDEITSGDGATFALRSIGSGPGIVILHGGGIAECEYRRLARALSDQFTVHLYNRRGRVDSRPLDGTETVATDVGDLAAVLDHTGARSIFGHSGGAFVALRAGLSLPLDRIAVYDPALSILGRPSFEFFDEFEKSVQSGDYPRALTVMSRGVYPDDPASKLPFGVAQLVTRAFLHTPVGLDSPICSRPPRQRSAASTTTTGRPPTTPASPQTSCSRPVPAVPATSLKTARRWRTRSPRVGPSSSPGHLTTRPMWPARASSSTSVRSLRVRWRPTDRRVARQATNSEWVRQP